MPDLGPGARAARDMADAVVLIPDGDIGHALIASIADHIRTTTRRPPPMSAPATSGTRFGRVVGASIVGTTVEWYDFFLYGSAAALLFNKLFFPEETPFIGVLLAFGTYAIGFAARPIGALVFGHFGDRIGRKKLLVVSLLMMGGATFAIGLLPTYGTVGVLAPTLLILLRLIQGFALGGEWGGAVLMVSEHGKPENRGFWSSWPQAGLPRGTCWRPVCSRCWPPSSPTPPSTAGDGGSRSCCRRR